MGKKENDGRGEELTTEVMIIPGVYPAIINTHCSWWCYTVSIDR
jgi:hypothetical protein